jgi:hypothetical protein
MADVVLSGQCGICNKPLRNTLARVGRLVKDIAEPLRKAVGAVGQSVVCDGCLRDKQPIPRDMGAEWARTAWAARKPSRTPLCARDGWDCPLQRLETMRKGGHTETLKPFNGSKYFLVKYNIAPYVNMNSCLCKRCYDEFYREGLAQSAPVTPASPRTPSTPSTSKRRRAAVTDKDIVDSLRGLPFGVLDRIYAWVAHRRPDLKQVDLAEHLEIEDPDGGTFKRTLEALRNGAELLDTFQQYDRGPGVQDDSVNDLVVDYLTLNSTPANTGRLLLRFPGEQHRYLSDNFRNIHRGFLAAHPDTPMSYGKFWNIRHNYAPYIVKAKDTSHAGCEYCNNVRFRLDSLRRNRNSLNCSCPPVPPYDYDLPKNLLCGTQDGDSWWNLVHCVTGHCTGQSESKCGLRASVPVCQHEASSPDLVPWRQWAARMVGPYNTWVVEPQQPLTATALWESTFTYVDKKCVGLKSWLRHIVTSRLQHVGRREILRKLRDSDAFIGFDWSRQYEFFQAHMIGKSSFTTRKANIFVAYAAQRTTKSNLILDDDEDWLVEQMEQLILDDDDVSGVDDDDEDVSIGYTIYFFVSDPTENKVKSNAGIAHQALERVFAHLQVGAPGGTSRVFLTSDGEFRHRGNLAWFGDVAMRLGVDFFWGVYGSGHGKDLYDGEGGVFKCFARRFAKDNATRDHCPITTPAELVSYGRDHLSIPVRARGKRHVTRRHFFLVEGTIPQAKDGVPVKGSSMLYAFRVRGSQGSAEVEAREVTCYCETCLCFGNCQRPGGLWKKINAAYEPECEQGSAEESEEEENDEE